MSNVNKKAYNNLGALFSQDSETRDGVAFKNRFITVGEGIEIRKDGQVILAANDKNRILNLYDKVETLTRRLERGNITQEDYNKNLASIEKHGVKYDIVKVDKIA